MKIRAMLLAVMACVGQAWGLGLDAVREAPGYVELADGTRAGANVKLERAWEGGQCTATLRNTGGEPVKVGRVVILEIPHTLPPETALYGEGLHHALPNRGNPGPTCAHW